MGPALETMYQFLLWLVPAVEKFPRRQKFLLGDRIQEFSTNWRTFPISHISLTLRDSFCLYLSKTPVGKFHPFLPCSFSVNYI